MKLSKASPETLKAAARIVAEGGVIAYPTDTVYGLGCDPFNEHALMRLLEIKQGRQKPFPVLAASKEEVKKIVAWNEAADRLAQMFWPGQLTIVLRLRVTLPRSLTGGGDTLAVRVPGSPLALRLLALCKGLLVGTSANLPDAKPPATAEEVAQSLGDRVDLIVDGGETPIKVASTVVDVSTGKLILVREGAVKRSLLYGVFEGRV